MDLIGISAVGGNKKHCPHLSLCAEHERMTPSLDVAVSVWAGDRGIILPIAAHCRQPFPL